MASRADDQRLCAFKARVAPWLDAPYFEAVPKYMAIVSKRCTHENYGVRLDETDRRCYCKGCGIAVDPFEALLHYAASEQRLVATRKAIDDEQEAEVLRKQREKERRPFAQAVVRREARKDLTLKAEPVIGYTVTLSCGHTRETNGDRQYRQITCGDCEKQARKARA